MIYFLLFKCYPGKERKLYSNNFPDFKFHLFYTYTFKQNIAINYFWLICILFSEFYSNLRKFDCKKISNIYNISNKI